MEGDHQEWSMWLNLTKQWKTLGEVRRLLVEFWASLGDFGEIGRLWETLGEFWESFGEFWRV